MPNRLSGSTARSCARCCLADAGITEEEAAAQPWASTFRANDRLIKTLLIAALVPEVEPVRNLTASRLAALNHGSIKTRIAGKETAALVRRLTDWGRTVGELKIGDDPNDPTVSIALSGVDVETVLERAKTADNDGARRLKIRQLVFADIGVDETRLDRQLERDYSWRGTRRRVEVRFGNVRDPADITDGAFVRPAMTGASSLTIHSTRRLTRPPMTGRGSTTGGRATPTAPRRSAGCHRSSRPG